MTVKMRLPAGCNGFSVGGVELTVSTYKGLSFVEVPDESVDDALSHGLTNSALAVSQAAVAAADKKVAAEFAVQEAVDAAAVVDAEQ